MLAVAQFQQWCLRLHLAPEASEVVTCVRSSPPARRVGSRANNVSGTYASRKMGCAIQVACPRKGLDLLQEVGKLERSGI